LTRFERGDLSRVLGADSLTDRETVRHTKPRFKLLGRIAAMKRRRKGVEFFAGLSSNTFFYFKKRNPVEARHHEDDVSKEASESDA
jgi:hypothetical protein